MPAVQQCSGHQRPVVADQEIAGGERLLQHLGTVQAVLARIVVRPREIGGEIRHPVRLQRISAAGQPRAAVGAHEADARDAGHQARIALQHGQHPFHVGRLESVVLGEPHEIGRARLSQQETEIRRGSEIGLLARVRNRDVCRRQRQPDRARAIRGAVVGDMDQAILVCLTKDALNRSPERCRSIVGRNADRYLDRQGRGCSSTLAKARSIRSQAKSRNNRSSRPAVRARFT